MNEIEFKVTIDEANLILEGLGNLPFARVYQLVAKLQSQASAQLAAPSALEEPKAGGTRLDADSSGATGVSIGGPPDAD